MRLDSMVIVAPYILTSVALLSALTALLNRRYRSAALALIAGCALAGTVLAMPFLAAGAESRAPRGKTQKVRLISFNMYLRNSRVSEAVDWMVGKNPDFIILLEAARVHESEIARLRRLYPYSYGCAGAGFCSTIILSRRPASAVWPLSFGDPENRRGLSAVTARFAIAGQEIPLTAVHLDRPWPLGRQYRFMPQLTEAIATVGRRGVIAGDFNSAPWTFAMRRSVAAGELRLASGFAGTWPAGGIGGVLRLPLDQVYIGPCMMLEDSRRGPDLGSDHLPVITDIVIGDCRG